MLKLPGDVIIFPEAKGRWVIMNVFSRTCLGVESAALEVLREAEVLSANDLMARFKKRTFKVWEIWYFSNFDCIVGDPTRYIRNVDKWPQPEELEPNPLVERFKKHYLLVENVSAYRARFAPKKTVVDYDHFGNLREQLAQEIVLRSPDPGNYWLDQKFTKDRRHLKNSLYKAIQENCLKRYFKRRLSRGDVVVDLGCGTGYYSNLMAKEGALVLGVDPNRDHIDIALKNAEKGTRYEVKAVGTPGALDGIPSNSVDYVFMSDSLLFYFVPADFPADIKVLLSDIQRILKKDGLFICCEPHPVFFYQPWHGDIDRPFTIVTENMEKTTGIVGSVSWHIQSCAKGDFAITWMEELIPDPEYEKVDARAYHFTTQFPLWVLFEMKPL